MELNEALILGEKEMKEKMKKMRNRALKRIFFVIAAATIAFLVTFFTFFKHREVEMTFKQFELLKMLIPWGYTVRYEAGIAIIENFVNAIVWSILISLEVAVLAILLVSLDIFRAPK